MANDAIAVLKSRIARFDALAVDAVRLSDRRVAAQNAVLLRSVLKEAQGK